MSDQTVPQRYKLVFYVPLDNVQQCKDALFAVGAGTYPPGKYVQCSSEWPVKGQFRALGDANPAIGEVGRLETLEEMHVEVLCVGEEGARKAVEALKSVHPYEEVPYEVYKMEKM